jgi:hypothetical protein
MLGLNKTIPMRYSKLNLQTDRRFEPVSCWLQRLVRSCCVHAQNGCPRARVEYYQERQPQYEVRPRKDHRGVDLDEQAWMARRTARIKTRRLAAEQSRKVMVHSRHRHAACEQITGTSGPPKYEPRPVWGVRDIL